MLQWRRAASSAVVTALLQDLEVGDVKREELSKSCSSASHFHRAYFLVFSKV